MQKKKVCKACGEEFENLDSDRCPDCGGKLSKSSSGMDWTTIGVRKDTRDRLNKLLARGESADYFVLRAVEREELKRLKDKRT